MKKSLLILSSMALAAFSAGAYDVLEPGTADSPNYYLIQPSGSSSYLTYTEEGVTAGESTSHLTMVSTPTAYSVWSVVGGSSENSVVIKNCEAEAYLLTFQTSDGTESTAPNSNANTSSSSKDTYFSKREDGSYVLKVESADWTQDDAGYHYNIFVSNGSRLMNSWTPTVNWNFTKVDLDNGAVSSNSIAFADFKLRVKTQLESYISSVPIVADVLTPAMDEVLAISYSESATDDVNAKFTSAVDAANGVLKTALHGKVFAIKNLRRTAANKPPYLALNTESDKYTPVDNYQEPISWFKFMNPDGYEDGYYLTNMEDNSFMNGIVPGETVQLVYPFLTTSTYSGVAFSFSANHDGNGFNMNNNDGCPLASWTVTGDDALGSIWSLIDVWDEFAQPSLTELEGYASHPFEPVGAELFNTAIDDINAIGFKSGLATKPTEIKNQALVDAQSAVIDAISGKVAVLCNVRREEGGVAPYVLVNDAANAYVGSTDDRNPMAFFTFVPSGDGFNLYNEATKTYLGSSAVAPVTDQSAAQVIYPVVKVVGDKYGIALAKTADGAGYGINWQSWADGSISYYLTNDGGSIWALKVVDIEKYIAECVQNVEAYIPNVPSSVAAILQKYVDDSKDADYASLYFDSASVIAAANTELETCLDGDTWTLRNLRRSVHTPAINSYLAVKLDNNDFESVELPLDETAAFKFVGIGNGGYNMYNAITKRYIALTDAGYVPVEDQASAQAFYPVLCKGGNFSGISFPVNANHTGSGFNVDEQATGKAVPYGYADSGSIWAVAEFDEEAIVESVANQYKDVLAPYVEVFPMTETVMDNAVEQIKGLTYSANLGEEAKAIEAKAIEDAMAEVVKFASEKNFAMKNLRRADASINQPPYAIVNADCSDYVMGETANSIYGAFKLVKSGEGYQIYNEAFKVYMTLTDAGYVPTTVAADAQVFYPIFYKTGANLGLSFCVNADHTGNGINVSSYAGGKPLPYSYNDPGSIWVIEEVDETEAVDNYKPTVISELNEFGVNVPMVKETMDVASAEVEALQSTVATIVSDAAAIETKAMEDGTAVINEYFHGKNISLKSLRAGKYACFTDAGFGAAEDNADESTHFAFHKDEDGTYLVGNHNMSKFLGPKGEKTSSGYPMSVVETKDDAIKVAPALHKHSGYCGVALPLVSASRAASGDGLNFNTGLYQYSVNDGGSIFAVEDHGKTVGIVEVEEARADAIYDLSGRRLAAPVKGINIINGKKVLVK